MYFSLSNYDNIVYKIIYNKTNKYFDHTPFIKRAQLAELYWKKQGLNKYDDIILDTNSDIFNNTINPKLLIKMLEITINHKNEEWINFLNYKIENSKSEYRYTNKPDLKLNNIISITTNTDVLNGNTCFREKMYYKYTLFLYLCCFRHLKQHGNMVQRIWNYCYDQTIDLIYIGLLLFKKITLCWGYLLYFEDFQPQIKENIIINILDNNLSFTINPKPDLYNLIEHINKLNNEKLTIFKTSKTTIIYKYHFTYLLNVLHKSNLESIYNVWQFLVNRYKITNKQIITLHKQITRDYFMDLREIIINNSLNKVLELNMGFGIVSYFIINTIKYLSNYHLTIIDEKQTKIFNNIGTKLINKYKDNYILIDDNYDNAISNLNKLAIDNE